MHCLTGDRLYCIENMIGQGYDPEEINIKVRKVKICTYACVRACAHARASVCEI